MKHVTISWGVELRQIALEERTIPRAAETRPTRVLNQSASLCSHENTFPTECLAATAARRPGSTLSSTAKRNQRTARQAERDDEDDKKYRCRSDRDSLEKIGKEWAQSHSDILQPIRDLSEITLVTLLSCAQSKRFPGASRTATSKASLRNRFYRHSAGRKCKFHRNVT
jgi:hypothetical protein